MSAKIIQFLKFDNRSSILTIPGDVLIALGFAGLLSSGSTAWTSVIASTAVVLVLYIILSNWIDKPATARMSVFRVLTIIVVSMIFYQGDQRFIAAAAVLLTFNLIIWRIEKRLDNGKSVSGTQLLLISTLPIAAFVPALATQGINNLSTACIGIYISAALLFLNSQSIVFKLFNEKDQHILRRHVSALHRNNLLYQGFWVALGSFNNCFWVIMILSFWPLSLFFEDERLIRQKEKRI